MSTNFSESPNPSTSSTALHSTFSFPRSLANFFRIPHTFKRTRFNVSTFMLSFFYVLILAACGPETPSVDHNSMQDEAVRIAQEYGATQDIDKARAELDELDVANINQWFKYVTVESIANNGDPNSTNALVQLALDLGMKSATIDRYGIEAGMIEPPPSAELFAPEAAVLDQTSASVIDAFKADENAQPAESQRIELVPINAEDENTSVEDTSLDNTTADNIDASDNVVTSVDENTNVAVSVIDAAPAVPEESVEEETIVEETIVEEAVAAPDPVAVANQGMNVRAGPGTNYGIVDALQSGEKAEIVAKGPLGQWWKVTLETGATGWLFVPLTTIEGNASAITVASNIPAPPPPTATALPPTPFPTPTFTYAPPTAAPVAVAPVAPAPVAPAPVAVAPVPPTAVPAPAPVEPPAPEKPAASGNTFKLIERRLWGVQENGGFLAGDSVNCGDKRELRVRVVDAAGNPINGVTVHGVYTKVDVSTGSQGKGDGVAEYVLGDGEDVKIVRDADGSDVSSDVATGMVTKPHLIDMGSLIQAGYCRDEAGCKKNIVEPYACGGHYSWDVKFQRNY